MPRTALLQLFFISALTLSAQFDERVLVPSPPSQPKTAVPAPPQAPKLDPRVRSAATSASSIRVLLSLADQPLYEVNRAVEAQNAFAVANADAALKAAAEEPAVDRPKLDRARTARDAATLAVRRQVAAEVATRVRPRQDEIEKLLLGLGATGILRIPLLNMIAATIPSTALTQLESDPRIVEISRDEKQSAELSVSVPVLGAPAFWNAGFTGTGESVVVLDSGINSQHPAFGNRAVGVSFVGTSCPAFERNPNDFNGHGTHVAGIVASQGTLASPLDRGVGPNLTLVSAKISCSDGNSFSSDALAAVTAVLEVTPATVINNSNGGTTFVGDDTYSRSIDELVDTFNLVWVNSAGNSGPLASTITTPGIAYNAITVGNIDDRRTATRTDDVIRSSSSRGPTMDGRFKPDIVAPGTNISSAEYSSNGLVTKSGTSMAAPHIAGAAGLLRQAGLGGRLSIKALLINTTDTTGWNANIGWGSANLTRAFAQRNYVVGGSVSNAEGDYKLFRGPLPASGNFFATLTWNRTYRTSGANFLRDLDLFAYDMATGANLADSISVIQNVEQASFTGTAPNVVVKVRADDDGRGYNEPFAVAISGPGFVPLTAPVLGLTCTAPGSAPAGSSVTIECTVTNTGGAPLIAPALASSIGDAQPTSHASLTTIQPNANATRSFTVTAPNSGSSFTLNVTSSSITYGQIFSVSRALNIGITGGSIVKPAISANGVVNAASSQLGLSSSQWITIRGADLAPATRTLAFVNGAYPTSADGVSVTVDGRPAFLYYLSPTQINLVSPDLNRTGAVQVVVTRDGVASDPINVTAQSASPAAFLWPGGYAVATDPNYGFKIRPGTFAGVATTAAKPGEVIILWVTGLGPTNPAIAAGRQVPVSPLHSVAGSLTVTIGGAPAELFGAALAPGNASLYQIALRVPDLANGDHEVITTVGGVRSVPASVTVQR